VKLSHKIILAIGLVGLATFLYAWQVEPFWIETTYHTVAAGLKTPVKMVVLSDLHTRRMGRLEKKVQQIISDEKPDLIVVVGDSFIGSDHSAPHALLSSLKAPLGVWLVRGNWEYRYPVSDEKTYYVSAGVHLLVNSRSSLREDISIVGFDDIWLGRPSIPPLEKNNSHKVFQMALFHEPIFFDHVAERYPLCLSAHTHGGQVRVPGLPPFWLPADSGKYVEGWYTHGRSKMYITRGVGTSLLPIRLFCRPEIPVITIR
jgi:predicted MPP superfamily phosphohydrolase